jgi:hypothetical protein
MTEEERFAIVKCLNEKQDIHSRWQCDFCESEQNTHNCVYVVGNVKICSACIEEHLNSLELNKLQVAERVIACVFCGKDNLHQDIIYCIKNKKKEKVGICPTCILNNKEKFNQGMLIPIDTILKCII